MIYDEKTQLIFPFSFIRKHNTFKILLILSIKRVPPSPHHIQLSHVNTMTNQPSSSKRTNFFKTGEKKGIFSKHHSREVQGTRSPTMPFPGLLLIPCTVFFSPTVCYISHSCTIVSCASRSRLCSQTLLPT
jgi:hypothetical protein